MKPDDSFFSFLFGWWELGSSIRKAPITSTHFISLTRGLQTQFTHLQRVFSRSLVSKHFDITPLHHLGNKMLHTARAPLVVIFHVYSCIAWPNYIHKAIRVEYFVENGSVTAKNFPIQSFLNDGVCIKCVTLSWAPSGSFFLRLNYMLLYTT